MSRPKKGQYRLAGGVTGTARGDNSLFVSIYCRGTVEDPHDKWRIASFRPDSHEGELYWTESESGYAEASSPTLIRLYPPATQWLDGNVYVHRDADGAAVVDGERDADVFYRDSFRTAWMLKCKACGFARKIGNPRDAYPLLTALAQSVAHQGVAEVPVREFCRRVAKQLQ